MVFCCVANCKSRPSTILKAFGRNDCAQNHEGITFHRFPQKSYMKKRWITAVAEHSTWRPPADACVCSIHFEPSLFRRATNGKISLCKGAVPRLYLQLEPSAEELPIYHEPQPVNRERQPVRPVRQPFALVRQDGKTVRRPVKPVRQPVNRWKPTLQNESITFRLKHMGEPSPKSGMRVESQRAPVDSEDCKITQITEEVDIDIKSECDSEQSGSDWERVPSPTNSEANEDVQDNTDTASEIGETGTQRHKRNDSSAEHGEALANVVIRDVVSHASDKDKAIPRPHVYFAPVSKVNTEPGSTEQPKVDKNDPFKATALTFQDVFKSDVLKFTKSLPSEDKSNAVKSQHKSNTVKSQNKYNTAKSQNKYNTAKSQDKYNTVKIQDKSDSVESQPKTISTQTMAESVDITIKENDSVKNQELLLSQHILQENTQCLLTNVNSNVVYIAMPHLKPVQFQEFPTSIKQQLTEVQSQSKPEHQEYSVSRHTYQDLPFRQIRPKPIDKPKPENQEYSISRHRYQDLPYRKIKPKSIDQQDQTVYNQLTAEFAVRKPTFKKLTNTNIVKLEYLPEPSEGVDSSSWIQNATFAEPAVDPLATVRDCCDRATSPINKCQEFETTIKNFVIDMQIKNQQRKIDRLLKRYKEQKKKIRTLQQKLSRKDKKISTLLFCLEKTKLSTPCNPLVLTTPSNMLNQNNVSINNQNYLVIEPINVNNSEATKQNTIVVEPLIKNNYTPNLSTNNTYVPCEPDPTPGNAILESLSANTDNNNMVESGITKPCNPVGRPQQNNQVKTTPLQTTNDVKTTTPTDIEVNPYLAASDEDSVETFPSPINSEEESESSTDDDNDNNNKVNNNSDKDNVINDDCDYNGDNDLTGDNNDEGYFVPTPIKSLKRPNHTKFIIKSDSTEEQEPARKKTREKDPATSTSNSVTTNYLSTSTNRTQLTSASNITSTHTTTGNNKTQPTTKSIKLTTSNTNTQLTTSTPPTTSNSIKLINSQIIKPANSTQITTGISNTQLNKTRPTTSNNTKVISKPTVNVVFQPGRLRFNSPTSTPNKKIPVLDKVIKPNILMKNVRLPTVKIGSKTPASSTQPVSTFIIPTTVVSNSTPTNVGVPVVRKVVVNAFPTPSRVTQPLTVRRDGNLRGPMENEI